MSVKSRFRAAGVLGLLVALVLAGRQPRAATAQELIALVTGCNNVALDAPAGTPLRTVAAAIQPGGALTGVFRYDTAAGRFLAFSPGVPDSVNDYTVVGALFEPVFVCMSAPGTFTRFGTPVAAPAPAPAPVVPRGVISAPGIVRRGSSVEVLVGTVPGWVCKGGVNIPFDSTFRFVPVVVAAAPNGIAVIRFDTLASDSRGPGLLSVRCADGQFIRVQFDVI